MSRVLKTLTLWHWKDIQYRENSVSKGGNIGSYRVCNLMTWVKIKKGNQGATEDCGCDPPKALIWTGAMQSARQD